MKLTGGKGRGSGSEIEVMEHRRDNLSLRNLYTKSENKLTGIWLGVRWMYPCTRRVLPCGGRVRLLPPNPSLTTSSKLIARKVKWAPLDLIPYTINQEWLFVLQLHARRQVFRLG